MGLFFSRKKDPEKPKITEQDKAILVRFISLNVETGKLSTDVECFKNSDYIFIYVLF
jgi:hypothetical protein